MYGMGSPRPYSDRYGLTSTYYSDEWGYNSRLDEVHAAILLTKLPRIGEYIKRRRAIAMSYAEMLADTDLVLPKAGSENVHAFYLYVCRHPKRDLIVAELARRDVEAKVDYPWPIHIMSAYASLGYREGDLPETELASRQIFSLPMYPTLTHGEQDRVCAALHEILASTQAKHQT